MRKKRKDSKIILDLFIPQMGEGIQEVKVTHFHKKIGEFIEKDQILYEMETDKSSVEIESPWCGKIVSWERKIGDRVPVGSIIGKIESHEISIAPASNNTKKIKPFHINKTKLINKNINQFLPPRTKKYCQMKGINLDSIALPNKPLMPKDIDDLISLGKVTYLEPLPITEEYAQHTNTKQVKLSDQQKKLNMRFKYSQKNVVPVTMVARISSKKLQKALKALSQIANNDSLTIFQVFSYCAVQATAYCPKFRSALVDAETLEEAKHLNLGVAVTTRTGDLMTAVLVESDRCEFSQFIQKLLDRIETVFQGKDEGELRPHIIISYVGESHILWGSPLLVEPSVATIFFSTDKDNNDSNYISITVDHRIINGLDVANFVDRLVKVIDEIGDL